MPVTELDFPSVTVCRQGIDMAAVMKALELDFELWQDEEEPGPSPETRVKREVRDLDTFMRERYGPHMKIIKCICLCMLLVRSSF